MTTNFNFQTLDIASTESENVWGALFAAKQNNTVVSAMVTGMERHSLMKKTETGIQPVEVKCWVLDLGNDVKGLVPQFETNVEKSNEFKKYVGMTIPVMIIHIDQDGELVLCSQQKALGRMQEIAFKRFQVGEEYLAIIRTVIPERLIVEVMGLQFSFPRYNLNLIWKDLRGYYKEGDEIKIKIKGIDRENKKVLASPVLRDPWEKVGTKYQQKGQYLGTIVKTIDQGYWVQLEPGLDVFCPHPSSWAKAMPKEKDQVMCKLQRIYPKRRRLEGIINRVMTSTQQSNTKSFVQLG